MWISGKFTTASEPRESGCSGSDMEEMRSTMQNVSQAVLETSHAPGGSRKVAHMQGMSRNLTVNLLFVNLVDRIVIRIA